MNSELVTFLPLDVIPLDADTSSQMEPVKNWAERNWFGATLDGNREAKPDTKTHTVSILSSSYRV